jgi:hypothetical protein
VTTATKAKKKSTPAVPAQAATNGHDVNGSAEPKPEPKPGEKGFDWQGEYPDEQVFVWTAPKDQKDNKGNDIGGQTIGLAAISKVRQPSVGFLRRVRHKQEFDQVVDMIEMVASESALSLLDEWNPSDLQDMFEQWNEWSSTTAGEASRP